MEQRVPLREINQRASAGIGTVASALVLAAEGPTVEAVVAYDEYLLRSPGEAGLPVVRPGVVGRPEESSTVYAACSSARQPDHAFRLGKGGRTRRP